MTQTRKHASLIALLMFASACGPARERILRIDKIWAGAEDATEIPTITTTGNISISARVTHEIPLTYFYTSDKNANGFKDVACGATAGSPCRQGTSGFDVNTHTLSGMAYYPESTIGLHTLTLKVSTYDATATGDVQINVVSPFP